MYNKTKMKVGDSLLKIYCEKINENISEATETIWASAGHIKNENRKNEYISGRMLVTKALNELGFGTEAEFKIQNGGKVYVENAPEFSISHEGELVACAISDSKIGIDAVKIQRFERNKASRVFTGNEKTFTQNNVKKTALLWSVKESFGKMLGEGLSKKVINIDFSSVVANEKLPWGEVINGCYFFSMEKEGFIITICSDKDEIPEVKF